MSDEPKTFIIECHECRAKVAAKVLGTARRSQWIEEAGAPYGEVLSIGECPQCQSWLVGEASQLDFAGYDSDFDRWGDFVRVYPKPPKVFSSYRIPKVVKDSLLEAERSLQASANIAGTVMLGRTLEALCRDVIENHDAVTTAAAAAAKTPSSAAATPTALQGATAPAASPAAAPSKKVMLGQGLQKLKDLGIIDKRLFDWSQQLQAFRNLAAHPEDISISREDAADLQTFTYAIVEYVYDLSDKYEEFQKRVDNRSRKTFKFKRINATPLQI